MPELVVRLDLSLEQVLQAYRGEADAVLARAEDGRTVQFPAGALRQLVQPDGVRGRFRLRVNEAGRLLGVDRLG